MPGLHWPFVLASLPPRRKKPVQPGFTAEELLYLEEVLAVIDSMHESDDTRTPPHDPEHQLGNQHAPAHTTPSRSPSSSSAASSVTAPTSRIAVQSLRSRATEAKLWGLTHPSTLGIFLIFLATLLLSHSSHQGLVSVSGLLGAGCLGVGLKILVASEDQAHIDPEHQGASLGKDRGRARVRGRRSRRHTASSSAN